MYVKLTCQMLLHWKPNEGSQDNENDHRSHIDWSRRGNWIKSSAFLFDRLMDFLKSFFLLTSSSNFLAIFSHFAFDRGDFNIFFAVWIFLLHVLIYRIETNSYLLCNLRWRNWISSTRFFSLLLFAFVCQRGNSHFPGDQKNHPLTVSVMEVTPLCFITRRLISELSISRREINFTQTQERNERSKADKNSNSGSREISLHDTLAVS